jgi:8-oxo-dGDP phosphatase
MQNSDNTPLTPWEVTKTRTVLKDRWIDVRADTCVTSAGAVLSPFYVLQPPDWVHVLAVDDNNRAVMVRQYRHGLGGASLEAPGGTLDPDDASPAAAASRELLEETGYACDPLQLAGRMSPNPSNHNNMLHIFAARGARFVQAPQREAGETMRTELVPVADLRRMMFDGSIVNGLHIAAVLLALQALGA